jgi:hypothetical protein
MVELLKIRQKGWIDSVVRVCMISGFHNYRYLRLLSVMYHGYIFSWLLDVTILDGGDYVYDFKVHWDRTGYSRGNAIDLYSEGA